MKILKYICLAAGLLLGSTIRAQEIMTPELTIKRTSYYDLELSPTGKTIEGELIQKVVLVMDSVDVNLYERIAIESPERTMELKVADRRLRPVAQISYEDASIRLDMTEWSELSVAQVIGTKADGSRVVLRPRPDPEAVVHEVRRLRAPTRDIEIITNKEVPAEELEYEKEASKSTKDF